MRGLDPMFLSMCATAFRAIRHDLRPFYIVLFAWRQRALPL